MIGWQGPVSRLLQSPGRRRRGKGAAVWGQGLVRDDTAVAYAAGSQPARAIGECVPRSPRRAG